MSTHRKITIKGELIAILLIFPIFVFLSSGPASAQQWAKIYGNPGNPYVGYDGGFGQQTTDGGYAEVSHSYDVMGNLIGAGIHKLDSSGSIQWQKLLRGTLINSFLQTTEGGYMMAGGWWSALIVKLDPTGNVQWATDYGASPPYSIEQTTDGGYIVAGLNGGVDQDDFWILKLDSEGNIQWSKTYGGGYSDVAYSIEQTTDGGYIVAGFTSSFGAGGGDVWILKLDSVGNIQWQKTYGGPGDDRAYSVQQTSDGSYIAAGFSTSFNVTGFSDGWVLKLDSNGNILWQKIYSGEPWNVEGIQSIQQTIDGGYIACGYNGLQGGTCDAWVLKLDGNGNVQWQKAYGGTSIDLANSIQQTMDGEYIASGFTRSWGSQVFLLKLDSNGEIPDCSLMRTSNAQAIDTDATVQDTHVTGVDSHLVTHAVPALTEDLDTTASELCNFTPLPVPSVDLPRTGQTKCYDTAGTEIPCAGTGQDGEIQAGVAWPDPRFTDNGDETITDNLTGLTWTKDAGTPTVGTCSGGIKTWQEALDYVACLNSNNYIGHNDWRLPNLNELESPIDSDDPERATGLNAQGFSNVQSSNYWSSTTLADLTNYAWIINMGYSDEMSSSFKSDYHYVWPVRAGQSGSPDPSYAANIWRTGQTVSYAAGDDGDLERGVAWPVPRFSDWNDGTVTDNLTGLMWAKNANAPGPSACAPETYKTWQDALDYVACLNSNNYLGYNNWRLPNWKELRSLIDSSNFDPALPLGHPFNSVQTRNYISYWSSTTYADITNVPWVILMWYGDVEDSNDKDGYGDIWPVRGGILTNIDTASPSLVITSHTDGQNVTTSSITLAGTASDAGNGDNGIQQVTVNGSRADNDTAIGSGTVNWSKVVNLNAGANAISVIAYDNSTNHNQTSKNITIYYDVPDTTAPTTTPTPPGGTYASPQSVTLTCDDNGGSGCKTTYYCLGSGCNATTVYSGPINISSSTDLRFYSTDNANNSESIKTETYTINILPPAVTCTLTPSGATQLSRGSNLNFTAVAQNNTDEVQVFQFATRITLPNLHTYPSSGWLVGPVTVTLNAHESKSKLMTQWIPYNAPFGTYTYRAYVGTVSPPLLYNQCQFTFSVNP
jgi:hypothetical protein